ncbi:iron complex outermembrane receptor protein [Novosphingobium sp. 1529]|uniref:TonB-dependent receptor n=1 Tax=Novosphingobium sp. 1529 TaxID=3156424 RepID=UPI00339299A0
MAIRSRRLSSALLASGFIAAPALAQAAPDAVAAHAGDSGEIVVTAQKREQSVQNTSLAVTALGGAALASVGRQDVTALAGQVPSLQVNQYSPTITVFNIRGVSQNDFADSQEAPIAFYNDEVYVGALGAISGQTFDLQRVEILRGPQGTLFGRNATGGLVQIVTAKPTRQFEGFGTLTIGSYGQVATEGAVSGPLSDHVRARLAFTSNYHGGYIKNDIGPNRGGSKFYGGRFQIESDVGEQGTLRLKVQYLRNDHERSSGAYSHVALGVNADGLGYALPANQNFWGTCNGCDAVGYRDADGNPFTISSNTDPRFDRTYWSATLRYEQKIGDVDLVSITDYQKLKKNYGEDSDIGPTSAFNYTTAQDLYQLSQELHLSGKTSRLQWLVGAYGMKIRTDNAYVADLAQSLNLVTHYGGRQNTESLAVFGQGEYEFSPLVHFILGARYSWDWKDYNFALTAFDGAGNNQGTQAFNPTLYPALARETFGNYSLKAQFDIRPANNVLLYAGVNRGTKSGGFGVQAFPGFDPSTLPYGQEVLTNYEAGFKTQPLPGMTFNGSIFHYDYKNYQAFTIVGLSQFITNRPARINGVELELGAHPLSGLSLQAFLTYLDTKVRNITLPAGRVTDRVMPQAPRWSIGGRIQYQFPVGPGDISLQTDWKYDDVQYFSTFNAPIDREPQRVVGNARVAFKTRDTHWEIAAFVNNLTDKWYRVYNLDLSGALGLGQQTFATPRWIGASISYKF